ncbi:MAG: hypothetical protein ACXVH0_07770, partial [Thermoanaerobaculia bacterium]
MFTLKPTPSRHAMALAAGLILVLTQPMSAETPTPKDPKSPVAGFADGRGPSGPVGLKIVSPGADEVIPIPEATAGQPPAKVAPVTL